MFNTESKSEFFESMVSPDVFILSRAKMYDRMYGKFVAKSLNDISFSIMLVRASIRSVTELIEVKIKSILDWELAPVTRAGVEFKTVGVSAWTVLLRIGDIIVDMRVDFR